MKYTKKLLAAVMVMVMALALGSSLAFAAGTGTITITPPENSKAGDSHTYLIYKVFDADASTSGISYKLMADHAAPITATDNLSKFDVDGAGNVFYYTRANTSAEWTLNDDPAAELSAGMIEAIGNYIADDDPVATATSTGTTDATAAGLANGYYYIKTSTGTVVTIDSTNPNAEVIDKNTLPSVDKSITGITNDGVVEDGGATGQAKIGDIVTYTATVHAKTGAVNYIFHDKMSAGLSLEAQSNLTITVDGTAVPAAKYTVAYWNDTDATTETDTEAGDNITIRFDNDYLKTLTADGDKDIVISYKVKVNDNAVIAGDGNPNEVVLEYGHNPSDASNPNEPSSKTEKDEATVYTYAAALKKVNAEGTPLADAVFQLPFYVKDAGNGVYIYAGTTAGDGLVNTITTTTANNGEITIKGLQDNKTYSITETVAPSGYNKITGTVDLKPVKTSTETTTITRYLDEDGNVVEEETETVVTYEVAEAVPVSAFSVVVNKQGAELPSTGGMGTTILYVAGGIMVLLAGVYLITKRRASKEEEL